MAEEASAAAQPDAQSQVQLKMIGQYIRDLSFENPGAGQQLSERPDIQVTVNVNSRPIEGQTNRFEVSVALKAVAKIKDQTVFMAEVDQAGSFLLENAPENMRQPILLIECPRLLFPFARRVLADMSRDGGYPPVMLDLIDFAALYRNQLQQAQAQQQVQAGNA